MDENSKNTKQSEADRLLAELLRKTDQQSSADHELAEAQDSASDPAEAPEEDAPLTEASDDTAAAHTGSKRSASYTRSFSASASRQMPRPQESDLHAGEDVRIYEKGDTGRMPRRNETTGKRSPNTRTAQQRKQAATAKPKKKRRRTNLNFVLVWTTLMVAFAIVLSVTILALGKDMFAVGKSGSDKIFVVEAGSSTTQIAQQLYDEEIIRVPKLYRLISKMNGADGTYVAGEHVVSASMSYESIIKALTTPVKRETVKVMFKEGCNLYEAAQQLQEAKVCEADRFLYFFNNGFQYDFEKQLTNLSNLKFYAREGYLYPDTYEFYVNMEPELVCQKIYRRFNEIMENGKLASMGNKSYYDRMKELNVSLDYVITLASIVQAEAPTPTSMQMVSSVFWNRLHHSDTFPLLQSDPTRKYAEDVIKKHAAVENPVIIEAYNTYKGQGLPPGAICNPSKAAIEAVLASAETEYYFFCANVNTKEIYYAKTNAEHEQNLALIQSQIGAGELGAGEGDKVTIGDTVDE